jgi:multiple sugar transport system substrate-binding protein/putative spermidine/putrescine transport system substrate-binding protein
MTKKIHLALLLSASSFACSLAFAQAPLKFAKFNEATLTRDNFYQVLEPIAKREGKLVLYNYAGNFDPVWKNGLIPRFEARYGVKVEYQNVRLAQANQQLMAVHKVGAASPVDVYSAGNTDSFDMLRAAGIMAKLDLAKVVPNLAAVPAQYKDVVFGVNTGGTWPLMHLNQTAMGYDSAFLPPAEVPKSFESLLAWAEKHPKKLAVTSPAKGGSGSGFLYAAALNYVTDPACRRVLLDQRVTEDQAAQWATTSHCMDPAWAYLSKLLKVSELTNGNADTLNLINNKQALIGTTWEDLTLTFIRSKQLPETFRLTLLDKGMVASGDGLIIPANAKSPAAALLFVDMAFSREFQVWKLEHHASRSPRTDIDSSTAVSAATVPYLVPSAQIRTRSIPANWGLTRGLVRVFEDQVLAKL